MLVWVRFLLPLIFERLFVKIEKLKTIAESIENGLIEKIAIGEIKDYTINLDDNNINIFMFKDSVTKEIPVKLSIKNDL